MTSSTRERLLEAATQLFAEHGFRGASVRDLCDLARANPAAVSYHFGGKRQLYRAVLRQAADRLTHDMTVAAGTAQFRSGPSPAAAPAPPAPDDPLRTFGRILRRIREHPRAVRLLLRDLADGGEVALQALQPALRSALEHLASASGEDDARRPPRAVRARLFALAAPIVAVAVAGPLLERALELGPGDAAELALATAATLLDRPSPAPVD